MVFKKWKSLEKNRRKEGEERPGLMERQKGKGEGRREGGRMGGLTNRSRGVISTNVWRNTVQILLLANQEQVRQRMGNISPHYLLCLLVILTCSFFCILVNAH